MFTCRRLGMLVSMLVAECTVTIASLQVFPRLKERDPYRRLGVSREASFEEVQVRRVL